MTPTATPPPSDNRPRSPVWAAIATALSGEIASGHYSPGDKLPTEAQLATRFGVNRHTVRHALARLAEDGLVHARRGAGVFVSAAPLDYPIGRRTRFHQNLSAAGQLPGRAHLHIETRPCDQREAQALGLSEGTLVHVCEGLSLAGAVPLALFRSVFPAARFSNLPQRLAELASVTQALAAEGLADYTRASTRIVAKTATAMQANLLHIAQGAPLLRTDAINQDATGLPVEYGRTWFSGDRVTLSVTPDELDSKTYSRKEEDALRSSARS